MALWHFHEPYKTLDLEAINEYPNKCPINLFNLLPNLDGNPLLAIPHVVELVRAISFLNAKHEDVSL